jgi:pimeloyl-ACP methyl ester carboxylesterase
MMLESQQEQVEIRIHGMDLEPTLVYLPGLHGDGTLISNFRKAIAGRVRFVEAAYPDTLTWSLDDHAAAVEAALQEKGVTHAWFLGESFSSQVVWPIVTRHQFEIDGIILAGGFVRHPARWAANLSGWCGNRIPLGVIKTLLMGYAKLAPWRFRRDAQTTASIRQYIERLTNARRRAVAHRLNLLAHNDPCPAARRVGIPVFALAGCWDPIVPWFLIQPWLKSNCPALRDYKILWRADHNVLGTSAHAAAELVLEWMGVKR